MHIDHQDKIICDFCTQSKKILKWLDDFIITNVKILKIILNFSQHNIYSNRNGTKIFISELANNNFIFKAHKMIGFQNIGWKFGVNTIYGFDLKKKFTPKIYDRGK